MATKALYALVLAVSVMMAAADCDCSDPRSQEEVKELIDFLASNNDNENFFVHFGELLPYNCGNCIEKNRKKRKIHEEESKRKERSPVFRAWQHAKEDRNKCPIGYRRVAFLCMRNKMH